MASCSFCSKESFHAALMDAYFKDQLPPKINIKENWEDWYFFCWDHEPQKEYFKDWFKK